MKIRWISVGKRDLAGGKSLISFGMGVGRASFGLQRDGNTGYRKLRMIIRAEVSHPWRKNKNLPWMVTRLSLAVFVRSHSI
jgi:hypothetical protein